MAKTIIKPTNDIEIWKDNRIFLEDTPLGVSTSRICRSVREFFDNSLNSIAEDFWLETDAVQTDEVETRIENLISTGDWDFSEGYAYELEVTVVAKPVKKFRTGTKFEDF